MRKGWKSIVGLLLTALAGSLSQTAQAQTNPQAEGVGIFYFEPITRSAIAMAGAAFKSSSSQVLSFDAYGRRFDLKLELNDQIAPRLSTGPATTDSLRLLRGSLLNASGSWVRLASDTNGTLRGMIWDGTQLYVIEPAAAVRDSLLPPLIANDGDTLIFKLADTVIAPNAAVCATPSAAGKAVTGQDAYDSLIDELRSKVTGGAGMQATGATRRLELSVLGDAAFRAQYASDEQARAEIVIRMNNVDGIYSNAELGVAIQIPTVKVDAAATQALSKTTDSSILLDSLADVRNASAELKARGLTHLFTGRDLDGATVGVAFRDALCRDRFGVGLTEARQRGAWFESLIAAHEIGHNFGAVHDGEVPEPGIPDCSATPAGQFLMSSNVVDTHSTFSQCSLETMRPRIAAASCITALSPADVSVTADLGTVRKSVAKSFDLLIPITNSGGITAAKPRTELLVPPSIMVEESEVQGGSCTSAAGVIRCELNDLAGGAQSDIKLRLRSDTLGSNSISIRVTADNDSQLANNSGAGTIIIDPETNLRMDLQAPDSVVLGASFDANFAVSNLTAIDAGAVTVDLELPAGMSASAAAIGTAPCTLQATLVRCNLASLAAHSSMTGTVVLSTQISGAALIRAKASGSYADPDTVNNVSERTVTVAGTVPTSGPTKRGGGGTSDGLILLGLGLAAAARHRLRWVPAQARRHAAA